MAKKTAAKTQAGKAKEQKRKGTAALRSTGAALKAVPAARKARSAGPSNGRTVKARGAESPSLKTSRPTRSTINRGGETEIVAGKKTSLKASRTAAQPDEKVSRAVKKLLAMKAEKARKTPRKDGFLIKAPKKVKEEPRLVGNSRFMRRANPATGSEVAPVTKSETPKKRRALTKRDLEELRKALNEERRRLIDHLSHLDEMASLNGPSDVNEDIPGYSIHLAEYASDNQIVETSLAQRALQAERLSEIEQALQRIGSPGYGICQNCSTQIATERLKIKPFAIYCVRCRELKEQGRL